VTNEENTEEMQERDDLPVYSVLLTPQAEKELEILLDNLQAHSKGEGAAQSKGREKACLSNLLIRDEDTAACRA
jgi:hypothetical protein